MSIPVFPPRKDADLLAWSAGFFEKIDAQPSAFGLNASQATAFGMLHDAYASAFAIATNPNTNSKANVNAKNRARDRLLHAPNGAWELVKIVQAFPGTTDAMRGQLGLRITDEPTPAARPMFAPHLSIETTRGRFVTVRLRDQEHPDKRGKPEGVEGATVLYWSGDGDDDEPPGDVSQWMFARNASKPVFDVELPRTVPAGSRVWLTAFWFNRKMQPSPAATAKCVHANDGLKLAA